MFYNNNWINCPKYQLINMYGFSNDYQHTWSKTDWAKEIDKSTVIMPKYVTSNKKGRGPIKK